MPTLSNLLQDGPLASRSCMLLLCRACYQTERRNSAGEWQHAHLWTEGFGRAVSVDLSQDGIAATAWTLMAQRTDGHNDERASSSNTRHTLCGPDDENASSFRVIRHPGGRAGRGLGDLPLFGAPKCYRQLQNNVGTHGPLAAQRGLGPGLCVEDLVYESLAGKADFVGLTRETIREQFARLGVKYDGDTVGVSARDVVRWCKAYGKNCVGLTAHEPLGHRVFLRYDPPDTHHRLVFVVRDGHAHRVHGGFLKQSAAATGHLERLTSAKMDFSVGRLGGDVGWGDIDATGQTPGQVATAILRAAGVTDQPRPRVLIVHEAAGATGLPVHRDLLRVAKACADQSGYLVTNLKFRNGLVAAFIEESTGCVVGLAPDYDAVEDACALLRAGLPPAVPRYPFHFRSQTLGTVGTDLLWLVVGELPQSTYSARVRSLVDSMALGPLVGTWAESGEGSGLDVIKSYTAALVDPYRALPFPVFDKFSEVVPFVVRVGAPLPAGEYIVRGGRELRFPGFPGDLPLKRHAVTGALKLPANLAQFLLDEGALAPADVTHRLVPSHTLKADTFVAFVTLVYGVLPVDIAKRVVNILIGNLGKKFAKTDRGFISDDEATALAVFSWHAEQRGSFEHLRIDDVDGTFFVRETTRERLPRDHLGVYNHVIGGGIVNLLRLVKAVAASQGLRVVGVRTDAVYFAGHEFDRQALRARLCEQDLMGAGGVAFGKYREEEFHPVKFAVAQARAERQLVRPAPGAEAVPDAAAGRGQWSQAWATASVEALRSGPGRAVESGAFPGPPGCGKSFNTALPLWKRLTQPLVDGATGAAVLPLRVGVLAFAAQAAANLRGMGITSARTLDSALYDAKQGLGAYSDGTVARLARNLDVVIVDEFAQMPKRQVQVLADMRFYNPGLAFVLFYDEDQCPPTEMGADSRVVRYSRTSVFHELVEGQLCALRYDEKTQRFDAPLQAVAAKIKAGTLPRNALWSTNRSLLLGVCWSNAKKKEWDARGMAAFRAARPGQAVCTITLRGGDHAWKQTVALTAGMPVTCRDGCNPLTGPKVCNCERLTVHAFDADTLTLKTGQGVHVTIARSSFHKHFDLGFCTTVVRIQGITIREPYNIHEALRMTRQQFYTAVTRATQLGHVHTYLGPASLGLVRFHETKFDTLQPRPWAVAPRPCTPGCVYLIERVGAPAASEADPVGYVGVSTCRAKAGGDDAGYETPAEAMQRRFEEHLADPPRMRTGVDAPLRQLGRAAFTVRLLEGGAWPNHPRAEAGATSRMLLGAEADYIAQFLRGGRFLYNKAGTGARRSGPLVDQTVEEVLERVDVRHDTAGRVYSVAFYDGDGKRRQRTWRYGGVGRGGARGKKRKRGAHTQAEARVLAEAFAEETRVGAAAPVRRVVRRRRL